VQTGGADSPSIDPPMRTLSSGSLIIVYFICALVFDPAFAGHP
jgi:hypothetical protein